MTDPKANRFSDLDEVRLANRRAGDHFFDEEVLNASCTRVETYLLGGQYFVTSELATDDPSGRDRRSTVRRVLADGRIETEGAYQAYESIQAAREAISTLLKTGG